MNDNRNHIGPNWTARAPRTKAEAFWPNREYVSPPLSQQKTGWLVASAIVAALVVAAVFLGIRP